MSNEPTKPQTCSPHADYVFNLAQLDLTLPEGITRQDSFTATSKLGAFSERSLKGIGEALDVSDDIALLSRLGRREDNGSPFSLESRASILR